MGLFGKGEDELRATGTPTSARVTYVDDSDKRRTGGAEAKIKVRVQIDSGSARGRELDKTKWVPTARIPRVGDHVSIRIDMDDPDDWAWGDIAMYQPMSPAAGPASAPAVSAGPVSGAVVPGQPAGMQHPLAGLFGQGAMDLNQLPQIIEQAFAAGNVTIQQSGAVIDARNNPELREQIVGQLKQFGVDVDAMERNGQIPPAPPVGQIQPQMPAADDVTARLKRIDDLAAQGLLTDDEHREQRQRIIDSI